MISWAPNPIFFTLCTNPRKVLGKACCRGPARGFTATAEKLRQHLRTLQPVCIGVSLWALVRPGARGLTFRYLLDSRLESSAVRDVMPLALPGDIGVAGCTEGVAMEPRYW